MSKTISFSRTFPAGHPKAGEPTHFVEKIWKSLLDSNIEIEDYIYEVGKVLPGYQYADDVLFAVDNETPKTHKIVPGKKWKAGDVFSPRVWASPGGRFTKGTSQIIIAPDIKLVRVADFEITIDGYIYIDGKYMFSTLFRSNIEFIELSKNDGLSVCDFDSWFEKIIPFSGQILIWSDKELPY